MCDAYIQVEAVGCCGALLDCIDLHWALTLGHHQPNAGLWRLVTNMIPIADVVESVDARMSRVVVQAIQVGASLESTGAGAPIADLDVNIH